MKCRFLLNVVIRKSPAIFQLFPGEDESLLIRWDTFLVLDLRLDVIDSVRRFDFKGDCLPSQTDRDIFSKLDGLQYCTGSTLTSSRRFAYHHADEEPSEAGWCSRTFRNSDVSINDVDVAGLGHACTAVLCCCSDRWMSVKLVVFPRHRSTRARSRKK